MSYLLDTCVISEQRKGSRADPGVARWFAGIADGELYLSALVIGELRQGVERVRRRDPTSAAALQGWLHRVATLYAGRILPVDEPVAQVWGRINVPDPRPVIDGLIAATALVHGLTLVTRNLKDFRPTGVPCVNPFAA